MSRAAAALALLAAIGACGPLDPSDQAGLRVEVSPADTAVGVGGKVVVRGLMVNGSGDRYPSDHIKYRGLDAAATVGGDGTVTGVAYGRARVVASRDDLADTGWVSVVPPGTLAVSSLSDDPGLFLVSTDGTDLRRIVSSGQSGGSVAWLPGDAGLVYQYAIPGGAGATELYVTDLAGLSRRLFADTLGKRSESRPRTSRDGAWVYFRYGFDDGEIWRVHVDGSGLEPVTDPSSTFQGDTDPDPSPDGSQVAFIGGQQPSGPGFQLAIRDLASGTERLLGVFGALPRWSPDGTRIAYWENDPFISLGAIFVIGADGTGAHQVSPPGRLYTARGLDWSPDGEWLVARSQSLDPQGLPALDLIQVQSGLTLPLAYGGSYDFPSWRR